MINLLENAANQLSRFRMKIWVEITEDRNDADEEIKSNL